MSFILISVDLEDNRLESIVPGLNIPNRVPQQVDKILRLLKEKKVKATFFTVGTTAIENKSSILDIVSEGHEIACHSFNHRPLTEQTPETFRTDTLKNLEALELSGAHNVVGYRAPCWSLVKESAWAWSVLKKLGFLYSSSVMPAHGLYYGWPGFGTLARRVKEDIWEIPVTSMASLCPYPYAGGLYLRILPKWIIAQTAKWQIRRGQYVLSYVHPYDLDTDGPRFPVHRNRLFNCFMYFGRETVISKLNLLTELGACLTHRAYVGSLESKEAFPS